MANRVKLELNEKFFKELTVTGEDGTERTVWRVSIPSGTKVNGIELSGASFLSNYAKDSTSKPNYTSVSFKEGQQVFLSVPGTNGQGEREYAKLGFKVEDLIAGIQEQREAWAARKAFEAAERGVTFITLNKKFVHTLKKTFLDPDGNEKPLLRATLPSGTIIDGRDFGGATFVDRYAKQSTYDEDCVYFTCNDEYEISLSAPVRDEAGEVTGYEDIKMAPAKVAAALKASNRAYWAARKAAREAKAQDKEGDTTEKVADIPSISSAKAAQQKRPKNQTPPPGQSQQL